jgi:hypothetical protein
MKIVLNLNVDYVLLYTLVLLIKFFENWVILSIFIKNFDNIFSNFSIFFENKVKILRLFHLNKD